MHQMSFGGRAPPEPAGGAYSDPPDPLAALKLLAPSALDPQRLLRLASRLRRSEFGHRAFRFFFFPIPTLRTTRYSDVVTLACPPLYSSLKVNHSFR